MAGGTEITPSLSFATSSGASNNNPHYSQGGSVGTTGPNNVAVYLIIAGGILLGLWIAFGRRN